jgi:hypothetical protein
VDLSSVYEGQADTVHRGVRLLPTREVLIQDELRGLKPGARVRWGMITPAVAGETGKANIELRQDDKQLKLSIQSPATVTWQEVDTATPRNEWDSPNRGTRMAAFEAIAPQSGELTLSVLITPGSCQRSVANDSNVRPLQKWSDD